MRVNERWTRRLKRVVGTMPWQTLECTVPGWFQDCPSTQTIEAPNFLFVSSSPCHGQFCQLEQETTFQYGRRYDFSIFSPCGKRMYDDGAQFLLAIYIPTLSKTRSRDLLSSTTTKYHAAHYKSYRSYHDCLEGKSSCHLSSRYQRAENAEAGDGQTCRLPTERTDPP
jgi:hypothetical protein